MQGHFYPQQELSFEGMKVFKNRYEGIKAAYEADLSAVEHCLGKCNINFTDSKLGEKDAPCLRKCYIKYLDSALLIQKEMTQHVYGQKI